MNNPLRTKTTGITDSPELIDLEKPEQGLELQVGSNVFRNTNGVLTLQNKEQVVLEMQSDPLALLLTMDFYDDQGTRVGHFYTHQGELVTISPHYCRIGTGLTLFGDVTESRGDAASIG